MMKEVTGWTVKTRTGRIYPSWIFETAQEAADFCTELNEKCHPQTHYVVEVALIYEPIVSTRSTTESNSSPKENGDSPLK